MLTPYCRCRCRRRPLSCTRWHCYRSGRDLYGRCSGVCVTMRDPAAASLGGERFSKAGRNLSGKTSSPLRYLGAIRAESTSPSLYGGFIRGLASYLALILAIYWDLCRVSERLQFGHVIAGVDEILQGQLNSLLTNWPGGLSEHSDPWRRDTSPIIILPWRGVLF